MTYHGPNLSSHSKSSKRAIEHSILIQVPDVQLHARMVLSCYQLVAPRAARGHGMIKAAPFLQQPSPHKRKVLTTCGGCKGRR